jgi:hypothetical protein
MIIVGGGCASEFGVGRIECAATYSKIGLRRLECESAEADFAVRCARFLIAVAIVRKTLTHTRRRLVC